MIKLKAAIQNPNTMRYAKNSAWMLAEYALKIISAIFVTIYVARYLGPEQFGTLSYALAIVAIFMAVSRLGMESILVRDIAKNPDQSQAYMSTAFGLMLLAAIAGLAIVSSLIYFIETDFNTQIYIWIIATGILFQTLLVIDYNFQAQVKAKYSSMAKSIALGLASFIKIYLVLIEADLFYFAIAYAIDHLIIGMILIFIHLHKKQYSFLKGFNRSLIKPLLKSAWPMVLSAAAFMLYAKTDQIMIRHFLDMHQLGLYAAAAKIFEGWVMIPFVLIISLMPLIVKLKKQNQNIYTKGIILLFRVFMITSVLVAILFYFIAESLINLLYGVEFKSSANVLVILMWAAVFTTVGTLTARYLVVEGKETKLLLMTVTGLIINFILNWFLIPVYEIEGAAFASLMSLFISYILYDWFDKNLTQLRTIKLKAFTNFGNF